MSYPILEYDDDQSAIIEPHKIITPPENMPQHAVMCFFQQAIKSVCADSPVIHTLGSEIGPNPVYLAEFDGKPVAVTHAGLGAPLAGAFLDELIALGAKKIVACGGAGVLDKTLEVGRVIIPTVAVRDEGMSYHYLPPGREVHQDERAVSAIHTTLDAHNIPHIDGKTWTTDAIYRETRGKVTRRKAEGCITVEMEAAAFFAVAQFRKAIFGQMLYAGDNLDSDEWDSREWIQRADVREKLLWLSMEAVLRI